jgi:hypothetical protein
MTREDLIGHIEDAAYDGITDVAVSHVHKLFDELDKLRAEVAEARKAREKLINERRQLRARLVECRPWVGVCPFPNTPGFTEMLAIRNIADDTLEEVEPWKP